VKVPTYKAQTRMTADIGARPMRVRATPEEFGAGAARAMGRLAEQAGDVAFGLQQQRQREIEIEQERQKRIAEKEADVQRRIDEGEFKVQYTEEITLAAEEAALKPEDQQEAFFDNAVANIRGKIPARFDDPVQQQLLDLDVEAYAVSKRVGVRRTANQARIEKGMSVFAQRETQLINQSIFGKNPTERVTAENDLRRLYESNEAAEYFTPFDLERRVNASQQKISYEREILRIDGLEDPDQAVAYIESLDASPPPGLDPTDIERLKAKARTEINKKLESVKILRSDLNDDLKDASSIINSGTLIDEATLDGLMKRAIVLQDEEVSENLNDVIESNETLKVLQGSTPQAVQNEIDRLVRQPTAGMSLEQQKDRARTIKTAESYLQTMNTSFGKGEVLDFLNRTNAVSVSSFDLNNIPGSIANRMASLREAQQFSGPEFTPNFFLKNEAQQLTTYINRADPEDKSRLALEFLPASLKYPQIWGQIASKNGAMFAMAGGITATTMLADPNNEPDLSISELIFEGIQISSKPEYVHPSRQEAMAAFQDYVGSAYRRSPDDESMMFNAVMAHYAATRGDMATTNINNAEFQLSMEQVTGGIGEYNDKQFELPRDLDSDQFEIIIDGMTPRMLRLFAPDGIDGMTDQQAIETIQQSEITNAGIGVYYINYPGTEQVAIKSNGEPVEFFINNRRLPNGFTLMDYLPSDYRLEAPRRPSLDYGVLGVQMDQ
jgi:hypothetical protein